MKLNFSDCLIALLLVAAFMLANAILNCSKDPACTDEAYRLNYNLHFANRA